MYLVVSGSREAIFKTFESCKLWEAIHLSRFKNYPGVLIFSLVNLSDISCTLVPTSYATAASFNITDLLKVFGGPHNNIPM